MDEKSPIRLPKTDVAPYSDATKLYWEERASLCLQDGLVYRLWETSAGDSYIQQLLFLREVLRQLHDTVVSEYLDLDISINLQRVQERYY